MFLQMPYSEVKKLLAPYIDNMGALTWLQIRWAILKMWNQDGFID
jgi:hypothetical protein